MKFTPVDKLPERKRGCYNKCSDILTEFMNLDRKYAKLEFSACEYTCVAAAKASLSQHIHNNGLPIIVKIVNGELYLIRKDLGEVSA